jgi:hypothetical protein
MGQLDSTCRAPPRRAAAPGPRRALDRVKEGLDADALEAAETRPRMRRVRRVHSRAPQPRGHHRGVAAQVGI